MHPFILPALLLLACAPAQAAVCYASPTGGGSSSGASWATASSLARALGLANCTEVRLKQGTYTTASGFTLRQIDPRVLRGGYTGNAANPTERSDDPALTVISGAGVRRALTIQGTNSGFGTNPVTPATRIEALTIADGNSSGDAGGVSCEGNGAGNQCSPTFANVVFRDNQAGQDAGALLADGTGGGDSSPVFIDVLFTNNRATSSAGAVYSWGDGGTSSPVFERVAFIGNQAQAYHGGALYNTGDGGTSSPQFTNVTFQGNRAGGNGGAMVNRSGANGNSRPVLAHATFVGNSAHSGGALDTAGAGTELLVYGSVFWGNTATAAGPQSHAWDAAQVHFTSNLIEGGCPTDGATTCTGTLIDADPLLAPPALNDGRTPNLRPADASPVRGQADSATCPATDQRGVPRPPDACDLGAVQWSPPTYTIGGMVSGLAGTGLVLRNNGGNDLAVAANGPFAFTAPVAQGGSYAVTVQAQPMGQSCAVAQGSGGPIGAHVTSVQVTCQPQACHAAPTQSGTGSGADWANATLLSTALAAPGCADIRLKQGTYGGQTFSITRELSLRGGYTGNAAAPAERSTDASLTRLDGQNTRRVLSLNGNATPITTATLIEGLTIARGRVTGGSGYGGGLLCEATSGAASQCSPRIAQVIFDSNTATYGGGLSSRGTAGASSPVLTGVVFRNNSATTQGGAMQSEGYGATGVGSPVLTDVVFQGNRAVNGGALLTMGTSNGTSRPVLTGVSFSANVATSRGGAVYSLGATGGTSSLQFTNATFQGNQGGEGGALAIAAMQGGTSSAELAHATLQGNQAATQGGALWTWANGAQSRATAQVRASVFWGNAAASGAQAWTQADSNTTATASFANNLIQGGCPASGGNGSHASTCADAPIDADPLLAALADNGGPTPTLLPGAGSPVRGQASSATCPAADQRSVPRPANACDLGAVQRRAAALLTASVGGAGTVSASPAADSGAVDLCAESSGQCSGGYETESGASQVTLTATPAAGHRFTGWSGDCTGAASTCTVTMDQARSASAAFAPIPVPTYIIGGSVSGLSGAGLVLRNNGGDDLSVAADGPFSFATPMAQGGGYAVTVQAQPAGQSCAVAQGSGGNVSANVTSVQVTCQSAGPGAPGGLQPVPALSVWALALLALLFMGVFAPQRLCSNRRQL